MKTIRGIRNNNPANIRRGSAWKGLVPFLVDASGQKIYDKSFCQFETMLYGVRALICLLRTYHYKYHLNSVSKVIHRFAPATENNTWSYIVFVVKHFQDYQKEVLQEYYDEKDCFTADTICCWFINHREPTWRLYILCKAICKMESGYDLTKEMYRDACALL